MYFIMKKRLVMLITACMVLGLFAGCADNEDNSQNENNENETVDVTDEAAQDVPDVTLADYNADELVTLGEYKGFEVTVPAPSVDDATLNMYVQNIFQGAVTEAMGVTDRPVENGDNAYISYVGKKDGVAFDGGTSEGTFLLIGSGSYIDGFEEGLVGVMPGETVDLNLTFPDPYKQNPDLAGAPVVFTVTVHYLAPEMTDEAVASMGEEAFSTVEELNSYVYDQLMLQAESNHELNIENAVVEQLLANTTFGEIPEDLVAKYTANVYRNMEMAAAQYGYDVDTYTTLLYGADAATVTAQIGAESARQSLAFQAVANAEGLNIDDEALDAKLQEQVELYGAGSIEELIGDTNKEDYRDYFMFDNVIAFLVENATVVTE